jgi:hypothetical protein
MSDPLHSIFKMLGEMQADITGIKSDMVEIKDGVSDYKNTKNKLIGLCVGVAAMVGGSVSAILNKIGIQL